MQNPNSISMVDFKTGLLRGPGIVEVTRTLGELRGIFRDQAAWAGSDPSTVVYRVQSFLPVPEGCDGGLFWGSTVIERGTVGDEYFMTKGHFHAKPDTGEFYIAVSGEGALILMTEDWNTRWERMQPGSVHYIPGKTAHRVANIGTGPLAFLACWPSDAGHDYRTIEKLGFSARLLKVDGEPRLVPQS